VANNHDEQQQSVGLGNRLDFVVDVTADPQDIDQAVARFLLAIVHSPDVESVLSSSNNDSPKKKKKRSHKT
jgi:hypothetical protein